MRSRREIGARATALLLDASRFVPAVGVRQTVARHADGALGLACLVATKNGLYVLRDGTLSRLLFGEFYGVTRRDGTWYVFQKLGSLGRLLCLRLDGPRLVVAQQIGPMLSDGCHQIDFIGDALYVADTYHNALLVFRVEGEHAELLRTLHPFGPLSQGRKSDNYVHMNSVWRGARGLLVVLHNETKKSGRPSELALLDQDGRVLERTTTQAAHAHNVIELRGKPLYCDSQAGQLRWGDEVVWKGELFTRGLAVTPKHILVGGSEYGSRENRTNLGGKLFVLDHEFKLLSSIPVPGMVQEIRALGEDLGLSQCAR